MKHLTQKEFKRMMVSAREKVKENQKKIDKINVFPVPDRDTGTNLLKTVKGITAEIENKDFENLKDFSESTLEGALNSAQGNVGLIYTGYLAGFFDVASSKNGIDAREFTLAAENGAKKARKSIQEPKEGTILDVMDAASNALKRKVDQEENITNLLGNAIRESSVALSRTTEKNKSLKKAEVVDAGGLGFLLILKGHLQAISGPSQFEVIALVKNPKVEQEEIKKNLSFLGESLEIVQIGNRFKTHIHTASPNQVEGMINELGEVENIKIEEL